MATRCICGNALKPTPEIEVVCKPCTCETPARPIQREAPLAYERPLTPEQRKRQKLGLPTESDVEKGAKSRWV